MNHHSEEILTNVVGCNCGGGGAFCRRGIKQLATGPGLVSSISDNSFKRDAVNGSGSIILSPRCLSEKKKKINEMRKAFRCDYLHRKVSKNNEQNPREEYQVSPNHCIKILNIT